MVQVILHYEVHLYLLLFHMCLVVGAYSQDLHQWIQVILRLQTDMFWSICCYIENSFFSFHSSCQLIVRFNHLFIFREFSDILNNVRRNFFEDVRKFSFKSLLNVCPEKKLWNCHENQLSHQGREMSVRYICFIRIFWTISWQLLGF